MKRFLVSVLFLTAYSTLTFAGSANSEYTILDVRTPDEYRENHLKGSQNIDFLSPTFKTEISKLDKTKSYKIYCRSGNRSGKALELMKAQGFKNLENVGSLQEASVKLKQECDGKPC